MLESMRSRAMIVRAGMLIMVLPLILLSAGCELEQSETFPPLTTSTSQGSGSTETTAGTQPTEQNQRLTVAMPLDEEGLEAMRLLFLARQSGLIRQEPGQYIGLTVLPDDLRQFDNGLILSLLPVPAATGATTEQVDLWRSSGSLPDIIYSRSAAETVGLSDCLDLTGYLYASKLLTADRIMIPAFENCRDGGSLYSIPYLASFPVIFFNNTLMMQLGLEIPAKDWTWNDWQIFAAEAQQAIDQAGLGASPDAIIELGGEEEPLVELLSKSVYVTDDLSSLLEWLPAAFDPQAGWAMWDGRQFDFANPALTDAAQWLSADYFAGHSTLHLSDEQRLIAFNATDAIRSGRILMWAGDSADMDTWRQAGLQVKACMMPSGLAESSEGQAPVPAGSRLPISVRSLAVSADCRLPGLAADLAAFIALDADALLLQSRYRLYSGLAPLINDKTVQRTMLAGQTDWSWLLQFTGQLMTASCSGQQVNPGWDLAVASSLGMNGPALLRSTDRDEQTAIVQNMIKAANSILRGGSA